MPAPTSPALSEGDVPFDNDGDLFDVDVKPRQAVTGAMPLPRLVAPPPGFDTAWRFCDGIGYALHILVSNHARPGPVANVLNELRTPLARIGSADTSFHWTLGHPLNAPRHCVCTVFVRRVGQTLSMNITELTVAYAIVERIVRLNPTTLQRHTVRPLLIGAACLAVLTCNDDGTTTKTLARRLARELNALDVHHVDKLMLTCLEMMGWIVPSRPDGVRAAKTTIDYQIYADALAKAVDIPTDTHGLDCYTAIAHMAW
jgi:hypothetical protein